MKVTMLVDTHYGKPLHVDDVADVPDEVAERWEKNQIARIDEYQGEPSPRTRKPRTRKDDEE